MSPPDEPHPPAYPSARELDAHRAGVTRALAACGVPSRSLPDVTQEVLVAAWLAIRDGRYRPDPAMPPDVVLHRWLYGLAWRVASHHIHSAAFRREIPVGDPWTGLPEPVGPDVDAQLDARAALLALWELPPHHREALLEPLRYGSVSDVARSRGVNVHSAFTRLHIAREAFGVRVRRR